MSRALHLAIALIALASPLAAIAGPDGGTLALADKPVVKQAEALSAEDQEVIDNLELLEDLDAAGDLDVLMDLSTGDSGDGDKAGTP